MCAGPWRPTHESHRHVMLSQANGMGPQVAGEGHPGVGQIAGRGRIMGW